MRLLAAPAFVLAALSFAAPAAAALAPGAKAPDFATRGAIAGRVVDVKLADALKRGPVVLYFFPAAFTGGCNAEARSFAELTDRFRRAGATVIGMSADPVDKLAEFSKSECAGRFAVASAGPAVVRGYDAGLGRQVAGRDVTARVSYVIGRDGRIAFAHQDMNPADHARLTLAAVEKLGPR